MSNSQGKKSIGEKSPKQKCLEMWEWLAANPTKNKRHYKIYLQIQFRLDEYSQCWACRVSDQRSGLCSGCPIAFPPRNNIPNCHAYNSPYKIWAHTTNKYQRQWAAQEMVRLIKQTWKE